jgi:hypothetical protein
MACSQHIYSDRTLQVATGINRGPYFISLRHIAVVDSDGDLLNLAQDRFTHVPMPVPLIATIPTPYRAESHTKTKRDVRKLEKAGIESPGYRV